MLALGTYTLDVGGTVSGADGAALYTVDLALDGPARVDPVDGAVAPARPFLVDPYGNGWHLCARDPDDAEDVFLWYRPRTIRSGGTLQLADGTEYDVRSSAFKRLDLNVHEDDREILQVAGHPHDGWVDVVAELTAEPAEPAHAPLIVPFLAVLVALTYREGRA